MHSHEKDIRNVHVTFTEVGVQLLYKCPVALCTYYITHTITFNELSIHRHVYKCTLREAIKQNKRYFIGRFGNHHHLYWSYEI
jgi:hypothetical protein